MYSSLTLHVVNFYQIEKHLVLIFNYFVVENLIKLLGKYNFIKR